LENQKIVSQPLFANNNSQVQNVRLPLFLVVFHLEFPWGKNGRRAMAEVPDTSNPSRSTNDLRQIEPIRDRRKRAVRQEWIAAQSQRLIVQEHRVLERWWKARAGSDSEFDCNNLKGLAFSGGGIRSATFCLGVLQALAANDKLKQFHLLSTVSGGGYIGSSLTWFLSEQSKTNGDFGLGRNNFPYGSTAPRQITEEEAPLLRYLREHGNYLTPGNKINLSAGIGAVLRGIFLNLFVWIPILAAVFWAFLSVDSCTSPKLIKYLAEYLPPLKAAKFTPVLFDLSITAAIVITVISGLLAILYSVWSRRKKNRSGNGGYRLRYRYDQAGGILLTIVVILLVLGSIPRVFDVLHGWISTVGPAGVAASAATALWTHLKPKSAGTTIPLSVSAPIAAAVFLYSLLLMSFAIAVEIKTADFSLYGPVRFSHAFIVVLILSVMTGWRANLNYITLHRFYRDRLMEAFMPDRASVTKDVTRPAKDANEARLSDVWTVQSPGPYPIINTNVVLVDADDKILHLRGGDSFILSPLFCGSNEIGWQPTDQFAKNGMVLPTAMAISGAAANPNSGSGGVGLTRNRSLSLLMSLLNIRLGYWIPNPFWVSKIMPRSTETRKDYISIANHFHAALYEVGGWFRIGFEPHHKFLQLSDGGHFENLGLYELIRRRTKVILLCDAAADPKFTFSDFIVARQRVRADFGVDIGFSSDGIDGLERLIPAHPSKYPEDVKIADAAFFIAEIHYPPLPGISDEGETGHLLYLKTTLTQDASLEVRGYKGASPDFPDETTADQFFSEAQFESYRDLGYALASKMLSDPTTQPYL
jgi:Patatin-like phospholipase